MTPRYLTTSSIRLATLFMAAVVLSVSGHSITPVEAQASTKTLTGQDAFTDYTKEHPGIRRHLTVADLPAPYATESANNHPTLVPRPEGAWPQAPAGFKVTLYATGFQEPRLIRTAPNGDLLLWQTPQPARFAQAGAGVGADGKAGDERERSRPGLTIPLVLRFIHWGPTPQWVYVANTTSLVRFLTRRAT